MLTRSPLMAAALISLAAPVFAQDFDNRRGFREGRTGEVIRKHDHVRPARRAPAAMTVFIDVPGAPRIEQAIRRQFAQKTGRQIQIVNRRGQADWIARVDLQTRDPRFRVEDIDYVKRRPHNRRMAFRLGGRAGPAFKLMYDQVSEVAILGYRYDLTLRRAGRGGPVIRDGGRGRAVDRFEYARNILVATPGGVCPPAFLPGRLETLAYQGSDAFRQQVARGLYRQMAAHIAQDLSSRANRIQARTENRHLSSNDRGFNRRGGWNNPDPVTFQRR